MIEISISELQFIRDCLVEVSLANEAEPEYCPDVSEALEIAEGLLK